MNYEREIQRIAFALKNNKTTNPKWRAKIGSRLEEVAAMCHMLDTREVPKAEMESLASTAPPSTDLPSCTCDTPGQRPFNPGCPIHGL